MTHVDYDWGKMARDSEGQKLLFTALKDILHGWEEDAPDKEEGCVKQAKEIVEKMKKR